MKTLTEFINNEIILERFIFTFEEDKFKIDLSDHADEQKLRDKEYHTDSSIICSICKVWDDIKNDLNSGIVKINDVIGIKDEYNTFNSICQLQKYKQYIKIKVITVKFKKNFVFKDISKLYEAKNISNKLISSKFNINLHKL